MKAPTKSYVSFNTVRQYITLASTDYWHIQYPLNSKWEEYYWDMTEKAYQCELERDENGITKYFGEDGKVHYSSIELAQYGMASYQAFLKTNDQYWKNESIKHIEHFLSLGVQYKKAEFTVLNHYPISLYNIDYPWPTGLGFGVAMSLLVRLYRLEKKEEYLIGAEKIAKNFTIPVEDGGILRMVDGLTILEEYPAEKLSAALNGHIFALWGLYDLGQEIKWAKDLFDKLIKELAENIHLWDGGYWSLYDLGYKNEGGKKNYASAHYHMIHVKQLLILYRISGIAAFGDYAEVLIKQKHGIFSRLRAFLNKSLFRLLK